MIVSEDVTPQDALEIRRRLLSFNAQAVPINGPNLQPLKLALRDIEGLLRGGIIASLHGWSILFIDLLWLDAEYRQMGYGAQLLREAGRLAVQRGCRMIQLDTFDFQAPAFYQREGYECFAILDDFPPGQKRYYFRKVLL
ncbi:GNAT family N-acetyltransferase [Spirosoma aerophilum]